jgi:hypothetical protein
VGEQNNITTKTPIFIAKSIKSFKNLDPNPLSLEEYLIAIISKSRITLSFLQTIKPKEAPFNLQTMSLFSSNEFLIIEKLLKKL